MEGFMMNDLNLGEKNDNRKHDSHEKAAIIRAILSLGDLSGKLDPWLPFPQNSCCFLFGKDKLPIPVGALVYLWDNCPLFTGKCPKCGGKTYSYAFGGLLSIGDIRGCCVSCGESVSNPIGGLGRLSMELKPVLKETPYYINGLIYGGTYEGKRGPLIKALKKLGIKELPGEEWALETEPSAASMTIKFDDGDMTLKMEC
jgi:ribosomal protein S27E